MSKQSEAIKRVIRLQFIYMIAALENLRLIYYVINATLQKAIEP